ncbi:MAG: carboxypeptidase regulatory-like domain-containing protein, partial [Bryobacteraceae bacterium]
YGSNLNLVRPGALFAAPNPALATANNYRPFLGYGDLNQATNNLYSNYNALQVSWAHQASRATVQLNYTLGKALGIINPSTSPLLGSLQATLDPFNLQNNYGAQPTDRRHIFNAAYSVELGNPVRNNKWLGGFANGWQISGVTQIQSGANLSAAGGTAGNFSMQLNSAILPGTQNIVNGGAAANGIAISNQSVLGTNAIQLNPILTCDPTANLAPHQFINGNCFGVPTQRGQNGPTVLPAIYGPAYFNSDLGLFKNFQIRESMKLQFRFQAYNFLNHPLWSFPNNNNLTLQFKQASPGSATITQTNSTFGYTQYKQGQRIIQLAVKFYF